MHSRMAQGRTRASVPAKAFAVPPRLGSYFLSLPRTYVRGYHIPPLRGWGWVVRAVSFPPGWVAADFVSAERVGRGARAVAAQTSCMGPSSGEERPPQDDKVGVGATRILLRSVDGVKQRSSYLRKLLSSLRDFGPF